MSKPGSVTAVEATLIGAASGVIEVAIMQPTVTVKNAMQQGRPLPTTPVALYRGLLVRTHAIPCTPSHTIPQINAASVAPITATQFGTNRFLERTITSMTGTGIFDDCGMNIVCNNVYMFVRIYTIQDRH